MASNYQLFVYAPTELYAEPTKQSLSNTLQKSIRKVKKEHDWQ